MVSEPIPSVFEQTSIRPAQRLLVPERARCIRRRPTPAQGRALEILGHAIEYLADCELRSGEEVYSPATAQALRTLMEASRAVFAECREIVPVRTLVRNALTGMFGRPPLTVQRPATTHLRADTLAR